MRFTRIAAILGAVTATIALSGCIQGAPEGADPGPAFEPAAQVELRDSPVYDAMRARGAVVIGVKEDQPGLGYLDPLTGRRSGFDIGIARWIAAELGFSEEQIVFKAIPSANREQAIVNGDIDYYVGTYSITDKRKQQIGFAGPYLETGQGLLVKQGSTIAGPESLNGSTTVCSATGSTPIQNIRERYPEVPTVEFDTYSQCVEQLYNGQVDAVTTDQAILVGYAAQEPEELAVVGEPFSTEHYGIGVRKDDEALRDFVNDVLEQGAEQWQEIYDTSLGDSGFVAEQPEVDRP